MKRSMSLALAAVTGTSLLVGTVALLRRPKRTAAPTKPAVKPTQPSKSAPADWLENVTPGDAAECAPEPAGECKGMVSSNSPPAFMLASSTGTPLELDAGKFLDYRFSPLPAEQHPTQTQLRRIKASFDAMGVDPQSGKLSRRPSPESVDAALDLATAFDVEKAPAPVGAAVRDFAKLAWQLPPLEQKA